MTSRAGRDRRRVLLRIAPALLSATLFTAIASVGSSTPPTKRASSAIAITPDGATLLVVNPDSATLSLVDTDTGTVTAEINVGIDPRTVAVDRSGRRAFVANHGSASVSVIDLAQAREVASITVGPRPYGVVADPTANRMFVTEQGAGTLAVLEGPDWRLVRRVAVGDRPSGIAVTADGATLLVTDLLEGAVTFVETGGWGTERVELWPDSNLLQSVVLTPDQTTAMLPHTRSNTSNLQLTFDTTVFPLVSRVDVAARRHLAGQHLSLDTIDPPGVGLPFDVAVSGDGAAAWVVNAASDDLTVVDLATRSLLAHVEVGHNPRGVVLAPDGRAAYVTNSLAGTVSVVDAASFAVVATWQVTDIPLPPAMLAGKRLFWSSDDPRMARSQWVACASCHFDGEHDGRTWQFGFAGPRNTTSLRGMVQSYPLRWSAEWDESADSEFAVTEEQFGSGLLDGAMHSPLGDPNAERSFDLDSLAAYLDGLEMPENHAGALIDPEAVARGAVLFADPVTGCAACHPTPYFTDFRVHDVGTASGQRERLGTRDRHADTARPRPVRAISARRQLRHPAGAAHHGQPRRPARRHITPWCGRGRGPDGVPAVATGQQSRPPRRRRRARCPPRPACRSRFSECDPPPSNQPLQPRAGDHRSRHPGR